MGQKLSFRPKGDIAKRVHDIVAASDGRITATEIMQAALEEYLTKLEHEGVHSVPVLQTPSHAPFEVEQESKQVEQQQQQAM